MKTYTSIEELIMTISIGFRCPKSLGDEVKLFMKKNSLNKTDAYIRLLEKGLLSENKSNNDAFQKLDDRTVGLTKIAIQILCITNQLGELAGEEVIQSAEEEYDELISELGIGS